MKPTDATPDLDRIMGLRTGNRWWPQIDQDGTPQPTAPQNCAHID